MKLILDKLKKALIQLENAHGPIQIFALFQREDPLEIWDIIFSAQWLDPVEMQSYKTISSTLNEFLSTDELVQFSRIVILNQDDPVVSYLQGLETITNGGYKELKADELSQKFKFTIKKAYLLRSQKPKTQH